VRLIATDISPRLSCAMSLIDGKREAVAHGLGVAVA